VRSDGALASPFQTASNDLLQRFRFATQRRQCGAVPTVRSEQCDMWGSTPSVEDDA